MLLYVDSQFTSPYAMSAFVALRVKGIPFKVEVLDLYSGQHASPAFAASSLTSRVPTLVDGAFALSESSAIAEYLEETHPQPRIYPVSPKDRARARQIQAWLRSDLMPLRQDRSTQVVFYRPTATPLSLAGQAAAEKLLRAASAVLAHGRPNLFDSWCIADVDLAMMLNRLVCNGDSVPPALADYAGRHWQHPAIQEWVGMPRPPL